MHLILVLDKSMSIFKVGFSDNIINLHQNCFKELKYMQKIEVNKMVDFSKVQYFLVLLDQMKFQARFFSP